MNKHYNNFLDMCKATLGLLENKQETWKHISSANYTLKELKVFMSGIIHEESELEDNVKYLDVKDQNISKELLISLVLQHIQKLKPYAMRCHNQVLLKTINNTEADLKSISENNQLATRSELILQIARQYKDGMNKAGFSLHDSELAALKTSLDNYVRISSTRKTIACYQINSTANIDELVSYCKYSLKRLDNVLEEQVKDKEFINMYKKIRNSA